MDDGRRNGRSTWGPALRDEVVAFLRQWLPEDAKQVYREMIQDDPANWCRHPHFAGGIIVNHALRGNGITERVLGVPDLNALWPELLEAAVKEISSDGGTDSEQRPPLHPPVADPQQNGRTKPSQAPRPDPINPSGTES